VFLEDTPLVARMLDDAKLRALLPTTVNPATAPDAIGTAVRRLQSNWAALMLVGFLLFATGTGIHAWWNRDVAGPEPLVPRPDPWRWRIPAIVGGLATALSLAWSNPVWMDAAQRWRRSLGGNEAVQDIRFSFAGPSEFGHERLQGAAPISPVPLRDQFYGTAPAGPELMTVVVSSRFPLTQPWLVVPYAGYPTGNGNGLRLRIVDAQGNQVGDEIGCPGPGGPGVLFWTIDVRAHAGRQAMLILYDGRCPPPTPNSPTAWPAASAKRKSPRCSAPSWPSPSWRWRPRWPHGGYSGARPVACGFSTKPASRGMGTTNGISATAKYCIRGSG
jgi:hypothetical protein